MPTPVAHPVAPEPVEVTSAQPTADPRATKPCGDACGVRLHAELDGWQVAELRWGDPATRWNEPFADRFELHVVEPDGRWGPLLLRSRPHVTYVEPHGLSLRTEDVDAGRLFVVEVTTLWQDGIGGRQRTHEMVVCKLDDSRCARVQADSTYTSPEGSELTRHFDVTFEHSRLVVRSPDEARCGAPPPGAVRSEDEPPLLWFGNHPWIDVFP